MKLKKQYSDIISTLIPERYRHFIPPSVPGVDWFSVGKIISGIDLDWTSKIGFLKIGSLDTREDGWAFGFWYGCGWDQPLIAVTTGSTYGFLLRPLTYDTQAFLRSPSRFLKRSNIRKLLKCRDWFTHFPELVPQRGSNDPMVEFFKSPLFIRESEIQKDYLLIHQSILTEIRQSQPESPISFHFQQESDLLEWNKWLLLYKDIEGHPTLSKHRLKILETVLDLFSRFIASKIGYPYRFIKAEQFVSNDMMGNVSEREVELQALMQVKGLCLKNIIQFTMKNLKIDDPKEYAKAIGNGVAIN